MTQPTSVLSDITFIAVNVHARDTAFQCKLHAHTPVVALLPQLRKHLTGIVKDGPGADYLNTERVEWALEAGPIRDRLDPENTLDEAGIMPGSDLYLTHRTRTESYPVLRDDIADGTAEVSKRMFAVLDARDTRRIATATLPFAVSAVAGIGICDVLIGGGSDRWEVLGVMAVLAVMCASVAAVLVRSHDNYTDVSGGLCVAAYLSTAAAGLLMVPRDLGIWHLTTVAAAVGALAVLLGALTGNRPASLHVGVGAVALCAVVVGLLYLVVRVSSQAVAAQLVFASLLIILWCTQTSRQIGRAHV